MACSVPHTDDEIQALVQKLIDEDMIRQKTILDLALQFDNACIAKDDLKKAYTKYDSDLPLTLVLNPRSSTRVETSTANQKPIKIIPVPAGIVPAAKLLKQRDILLGRDGAVMSTQEYIKKLVEDEDFKSMS
ncbi:hypothetical protein Tco_0852217 [Tanacetum coccineum]